MQLVTEFKTQGQKDRTKERDEQIKSYMPLLAVTKLDIKKIKYRMY